MPGVCLTGLVLKAKILHFPPYLNWNVYFQCQVRLTEKDQKSTWKDVRNKPLSSIISLLYLL